MAASGGSLVKGSVEDFEIPCKPCVDDGDFVEASGYCENCEEYLCIACMKVHCLPKPSKHHVVLDKQQMPQSKTRKSEVASYISTLANGSNVRIEYTAVIKKVDQLQAEVNDKLTDSEHSATKTEETVEKAISDIKEHRLNVNAYFDKVERILTERCHKIKLLNQHEVQKTDDELKSSRNRLTSIQTHLQTSNIDNVANIIGKSGTLLKELENDLKAIKKTQPQCVKFVANATLTSEMSTATALGELQVHSKLPECTDVQRKRVKDMVSRHQSDISTDTIPRSIGGIVKVRENVIACTDFNNKIVILVDISRGKLLSTVSVMDKPWDITSTSRGTFAVTIPGSSKIQFLEVNNDVISLKNVIGVNGECRGIDCLDDHFAVSYDKPPKVEIIDFHGNVQMNIQTDNTGINFFKSPLYVVFSRDGGYIYVSDRDDRSIIKLTLDGTMQASYKNSELEKPQGMYVCWDGSVLVCSTRSIHVMSVDCMKHKLLITGVDFPSGISFDEYNGTLCVRKRGQVSPGKWLSGTVWDSDSIQTYVIN